MVRLLYQLSFFGETLGNLSEAIQRQVLEPFFRHLISLYASERERLCASGELIEIARAKLSRPHCERSETHEVAVW